MKHTLALAALVVATTTSLAVPPAAAQEVTSISDRGHRDMHRTIKRDTGFARGPGMIGLVCSPRGAEAMEISFVRLSHRINLTDEQQPLFDAFKQQALTTQTRFADECASAMPDRTADTRPDLLERMKSGLKLEEARLAALNEVLPDFEAFYLSLTDEQKSALSPRRMFDRDGANRGDRQDRNAPGRSQRAPAPGR